MEPKKTLICTCEKCGNEAEMTIKCEELVRGEKPSPMASGPQQVKKTLVCTRCGNEADMIVDL